MLLYGDVDRCVQFVCQEGHGDFVHSIDERETCSYIVTVHTSRICSHPSFAPPIRVKSLPISCNPLLSAADYELYIRGIFYVISASTSCMLAAFSNLLVFSVVYFSLMLFILFRVTQQQ